MIDLRQELMPPLLDEGQVVTLTQLASQLDGGDQETSEDTLNHFNKIVGTELSFEDFQGIYGAEEHETWVRRLVSQMRIIPVGQVSRSELAEVVRRAMPTNEYADYEVYMLILDANVTMPNASNLIFCPSDYDARTSTWGEGRPLAEYDPTPEEIADAALTHQPIPL